MPNLINNTKWLVPQLTLIPQREFYRLRGVIDTHACSQENFIDRAKAQSRGLNFFHKPMPCQNLLGYDLADMVRQIYISTRQFIGRNILRNKWLIFAYRNRKWDSSFNTINCRGACIYDPFYIVCYCRLNHIERGAAIGIKIILERFTFNWLWNGGKVNNLFAIFHFANKLLIVEHVISVLKIVADNLKIISVLFDKLTTQVSFVSGNKDFHKKFSSPKIKIWFEPMFFFGFFCGFQRRGSAAFPNFRGGNSSPPQAAKCVRTNSRILHQTGKIKWFWFASLRSATGWYLILGVKTNSRFRILGEENFLILNF